MNKKNTDDPNQANLRRKLTQTKNSDRKAVQKETASRKNNISFSVPKEEINKTVTKRISCEEMANQSNGYFDQNEGKYNKETEIIELNDNNEISSLDYKNFLLEKKKNLDQMMKKKAEIKKTGLFSKYTDHQTIKMDFIYGDDFVFDRTLNEEYMDSTANKNNKKFGYHLATLIKKPLIVASKKSEEKIKELPITITKFNSSHIKKKPCENLENFTVGKILGQGSYAQVKFAIDRETNKKYAIKSYDKYKLVDLQKKKNVEREIFILEKLNHPNIISLFKTIRTPSTVNLVLEFIGTTSLFEYLKSKPNKILPEAEIKFIFRQLTDAVNYCHSKSIVHRDLKLENVLLDEGRSIKIIDFGFSVIIPYDKKLTIFCGTPSYMAPEIASKKDYFGPPVDVWALGIILYVMTCGMFPFKGIDDKELYKNIVNCEYEVLGNVNPTLKRLIHKILKYDPLERLNSEEILDDEWVKGQ